MRERSELEIRGAACIMAVCDRLLFLENYVASACGQMFVTKEQVEKFGVTETRKLLLTMNRQRGELMRLMRFISDNHPPPDQSTPFEYRVCNMVLEMAKREQDMATQAVSAPNRQTGTVGAGRSPDHQADPSSPPASDPT